MDRFAEHLLRWYDLHGRKSLPWASRDPYRIWVSEIMLQQTQVATVARYYEGFINRFPDVSTLAAAALDDVLRRWAGLGYYARARHLHAAARAVVAVHGGEVPRDIAALCALPGIGRSTAAAILAFAFGDRHAILDGNVRRVLARYHAVPGAAGSRALETRLWALASQHTPHARIADYTQAIMDLGATVCGRQPLCRDCPMSAHCAAFGAGTVLSYPQRHARAATPMRHTQMLIIRDQDRRALLVRRPPNGIWGGLWSLPEYTGPDVQGWCRAHLGCEVTLASPGTPIRHRFTHFTLTITPLPAKLEDHAAVMENQDAVWYNTDDLDQYPGVAAPVRQLLSLF